MVTGTQTKLFIDGGDPQETALAQERLAAAGKGEVDGQTTNPSLVAKNPRIAAQQAAGKKMTEEELLKHYREIVLGIAAAAPGEISVEVYADSRTTAEEMAAQAREFSRWGEKIVVKLPIIPAGLEAAARLKGELRLNMTLCFSQSQAAAVYAATRGAKYPVYVSPFIGRLDDRGENGMDLIANITRMYAAGDGHVEVLAASLRSLEHVLGVLELGVGAMTLPFEKAFLPWAETGFAVPDSQFQYRFDGQAIPDEGIGLDKDWEEYGLKHELTEAGLEKFVADWKGLLRDE